MKLYRVYIDSINKKYRNIESYNILNYQNKNNPNSKCADVSKDYKTLLGGTKDLTN